MLVDLRDEGQRLAISEMNSFTDNLQEFCLDFMQRCIPFSNVQNTYFGESLLITAYDSYARVLCIGLCNVTLLAFRNCRKTLYIDSPNTFINDIARKRIKHH